MVGVLCGNTQHTTEVLMMSRISRRELLKTGAVVAGATVGASSLGSGLFTENDRQSQGQSSSKHVVGSWTASPQQPTTEAGFTEGFSDQTVRNILRTSVGGNGLRLRLANTFGADSVTIDKVTVGIWDMDSESIQGTPQSVSFGGTQSVTILEGACAYSDPVPIEVPAEQNIVVDLYAASTTGPPTTHADSLKTTYLASGDQTGDPNNDAFDSPAAGESDSLTAWFFVEGVDVVNPDISGAVVCYGNSITDGVGSSMDTDSTYPDFLAERLNDEASVKKSVLNAGIGGNRLLNNHPENGINGLARLEDDALAQTGVTDIIFLEGINDIGFSELDPTFTDVTATDLIQGMKQFVSLAHSKGVRVHGGTLLPYQGSLYYSKEGEQERQRVNEFIRKTDLFDSVVDFDRALRDPDNPKKLLSKYDSGDNLHPSDAGYRAMAETVNLAPLHGHGRRGRSGTQQSTKSVN